MPTNPKYPNVTVKLTGTDGNAFPIMAKVRQGLRAANVPETELQEFFDECTSGDYNHLLATCMKWVNVV
jgi:hypothetical protein